MLDADGATKVNDVEKLEKQVCINCDHKKYPHRFSYRFTFSSKSCGMLKLLQTTLFSVFQIHAVAKEEFQYGDSPAINSNFRISDIPIAAFGSRAHLEEKALASV